PAPGSVPADGPEHGRRQSLAHCQSQAPCVRRSTPGGPRVKLSVTYLYTIARYGYPPRIEDDFKALAEIERLGFHYLEMEGLGPRHTEAVSRRRDDLKKCLADHGIHVHNFCAVDANLV